MRHVKKSSTKKGFTIIEVSLVLALTGALLAGLIASISGSMKSQRFYDSAQETAEFIRNAYSSVINPQNSIDGTIGGKSNQSIYGVLLTFNNTTIEEYSVIGGVTNKTDTALTDLNPPLQKRTSSPISTFSPTWGSTISFPSGESPNSLLIIRKPSGVITTLVGSGTEPSSIASSNKTDDVDICLTSADNPSGSKYDIRIAKSGSDTSAVQITSLDGDNNRCN